MRQDAFNHPSTFLREELPSASEEIKATRDADRAAKRLPMLHRWLSNAWAAPRPNYSSLFRITLGIARCAAVLSRRLV
jgi:hypothetical protein